MYKDHRGGSKPSKIKYYVNQTPTGWTITIDGKLRGSHLPTQEAAEHIGRMHTDPEYASTYQYIQKHPTKAVAQLLKSSTRKDPKHYLRVGQSLAHEVGDDFRKLSWQRAHDVWGKSWNIEMLRTLQYLKRFYKGADDAEAYGLLVTMARAVRNDDADAYDEALEQLKHLVDRAWY